MAVPEYLVRRVDCPDWGQIPPVTLLHTGWLPPCGVSAWAQACHDGERLFLRLWAEESDIRATLTGPLEQVCDDSCLEFFFAPLPGDPRYFNFECNPLGTLYLGFGTGRSDRVRQLVQDPEIFRIKPFSTEAGWGVTLTIPGEFIRLYMPEFRFSGQAHGNFYKCADQAEVPHYLAWSKPESSTPDYHRPADFGRLLLEG